jgi:hypothetical protein
VSSSWQLDLIAGALLLIIGLSTERLAWFFYKLNASFLSDVPRPSPWAIRFGQVVLIAGGVAVLVSALLRASRR